MPTASGDAVGYIDRFHNAFAETQARHEHLPLFKSVRPKDDSLLTDQDIIYIGGGSTANLLAVWRVHGVDSAVAHAYRSGTIVMGISAGAACLFSSCLTDSFGDLRALRDGMGILTGSFSADGFGGFARCIVAIVNRANQQGISITGDQRR